MPVFNGSEFIEESINSVLKQEYENWELICVNDGSTDNSLSILRKFSQKDSRILVFNQENKGAAAARCFGSKHCTGDYITLLDSDDCLSTDFLSSNIPFTRLEDIDTIVPVLMQNSFTTKEYNFNQKHNLKSNQTYTGQDAFKLSLPWKIHGLNFYRSDFFKKYSCLPIIFENKFNTDEIITRYLLVKSKKVFISGVGTYFYRGNQNSITNLFSKLHVGKLRSNEIIFDLAKKEISDSKYLKNLSNYFFKEKLKLFLKYYRYKLTFTPKEFKSVLIELQKNRNWENLRYGVFRSFFAVTFNKLNPVLIGFIVIIYSKIKK